MTEILSETLHVANAAGSNCQRCGVLLSPYSSAIPTFGEGDTVTQQLVQMEDGTRGQYFYNGDHSDLARDC